jgi:hypothetical protein
MQYFPFELRFRPRHEYRNLNFLYVVKLKLFLYLAPLHNSVFYVQAKSQYIPPPSLYDSTKVRVTVHKNLHLLSLVAYICALLYLVFS